MTEGKQGSSGQPKVLPNNLIAEQVILGAMLMNPSCIPVVRSIVDPRDFYQEAHSILCSACFELGEALDLVTLADKLQANDLFEKSGGQDYISQIVENVHTSAGAQHHCHIIKGLSKRRQFILACQQAANDAFTLSNGLDELYQTHRKDLQAIEFDIRFQNLGVDIRNVYDAGRMLEEYQEYINSIKKNRFITGIGEIDRRIRGVAGGEVLTIIARAGSFKTAMLQNWLMGYTHNSAWVAVFFSIEMPVASLTERYHEIVSGERGREVERWYTDAMEGIDTHRNAMEKSFKEKLQGLYVVPTKVSVKDIAQYVALIEAKYDIKVGVIGIDYLGLMEGQGQGEYEIISTLARDIKNLAKHLNRPIVLLCQVSRKGGSGEEEISLDHGRGSGAIEEAADFVLGLWQVERRKGAIEDSEPEYDLICRILKNRKGPKGSRWKLDLNPQNLRIGHTAEPYEPPKRKRDCL